GVPCGRQPTDEARAAGAARGDRAIIHTHGGSRFHLHTPALSPRPRRTFARPSRRGPTPLPAAARGSRTGLRVASGDGLAYTGERWGTLWPELLCRMNEPI